MFFEGTRLVAGVVLTAGASLVAGVVLTAGASLTELGLVL